MNETEITHDDEKSDGESGDETSGHYGLRLNEWLSRRGVMERTHRYKPSSKCIIRITRHKTRVDKNSRRRVDSRVNTRIYRNIAILTRKRSTHQESMSKSAEQSRTEQITSENQTKVESMNERKGVGGRLAPSPKRKKSTLSAGVRDVDEEEERNHLSACQIYKDLFQLHHLEPARRI